MPTIEEDQARAAELRALIERAIDLGSHYGSETLELTAIEKRLKAYELSGGRAALMHPPAVNNTGPGTAEPIYSVKTSTPIYKSKIAYFLSAKKWHLLSAGAGMSGYPRSALGIGHNSTCFSICLYEDGKPDKHYPTLVHATAGQPCICLFRSPRAVAIGNWHQGFYDTTTFYESEDIFHDLCRFVPRLINDENECEALLQSVRNFFLKS